MANKLTIENMQTIANKRDGRCLSKKYTNTITNLEWECEKGHRWHATPKNIKAGAWCHDCGGSKKLTIKEMQRLAKERNGKCLSKKYINHKTKLRWECEKGHRWWATPGVIKSNSSWCSKCAGNSRQTIKDMQKYAKQRNGKCLSKKYINNRTKLEWECEIGHRWHATPKNLHLNRWCPDCNVYFKEELCRTTFEQIFKRKFRKSKPHWLKAPNGKLMELDGYSKYYRIAFEYQGEQHYKINWFTKTNEELSKRKLYDKLKIKLCKENNVNLVVINFKQDIKQLPNLLKKKFKHLHEIYPIINFEKKIDFNKVSPHKKLILELKKIADRKKGKLLTYQFEKVSDKLEWECEKGHRWLATINDIKNNGTWCRTCSGTAKLTLEDAKDLAKKNKGKCLSKKYTNTYTNLEWECEKGHRWRAKVSNIKNGTWCAACSKRLKLTIDEMKDIAKERNGKCLSKKYTNTITNLEWECEKGHRWFATPRNIKNHGTWCKECSYEKGWVTRKTK